MKTLLPPLMRPLLLWAVIALAGCAHHEIEHDAVPQRLVVEDDQVRIDELRVRGQTQRLTVQPKNGARPYDILPAPGGQDPSLARDGTGQRVWPVFTF